MYFISWWSTSYTMVLFYQIEQPLYQCLCKVQLHIGTYGYCVLQRQRVSATQMALFMFGVEQCKSKSLILCLYVFLFDKIFWEGYGSFPILDLNWYYFCVMCEPFSGGPVGRCLEQSLQLVIKRWNSLVLLSTFVTHYFPWDDFLFVSALNTTLCK